MISLAKVHDRPSGKLVLVDRLWPRGISKSEFLPTLWAKGAAPSTSLRKLFHSVGLEFSDFARAYRDELDQSFDAADPDLLALVERARQGDIVLVFAAANRSENHAHVLKDWLENLI